MGTPVSQQNKRLRLLLIVQAAGEKDCIVAAIEIGLRAPLR
jgi:hypothetical protein